MEDFVTQDKGGGRGGGGGGEKKYSNHKTKIE
jgi:hypothetical protein